jgi:hypothetical protein
VISRVFAFVPESLRSRMTPPPRRLALLVASGLPLLAGCRGAALAYGPDLSAARTHFDELATGFEYRFTNVTRTPKVATARMRLARFAFAPSKLAEDTAIWTAMRSTRTGAERDVEFQAGLATNQFLFTARQGAAAPARVGDQRHLIALSQRGPDDWLWHTAVEHAVGPMPPSRLDDIARALFLGAERPASSLRADYRSAFPRTTQALGRLFSLDSVGTIPQLDGSTLVTMQIRIDARGMAAGFPAFAKYLQKYVEPARYRYRLTDRAGGEWFDAQASKRVLTLRFRTRQGELQPLAGAARGMPDTLIIHVDALARFGLWMVGVTGMEGEFVHVRSARERAWQLRFAKAPTWHLPLIAETLLSSAIRRPFEGPGTYFKIGLRAGANGQTLGERVFDVAVKESAIMRWLGNLGFTAFGEFAGQVEEQENRFLIELFRAMRTDMSRLGTS